MRSEELDRILEELYPEEPVVLLEPRASYDRAVIAVAQRFEESGHYRVFAVYDQDLLVDIIAQEMADDSEDPYTSAIEHFDFNIAGAYVGPNTPAFARVLTEE